MNDKTREFVVRVYDTVHAALWASLITFVIYFAVIVVPLLPEARVKAESQRILEISAEHNFYCEKWNMGAATPTYGQCMLDLQAFRATVERRFTAGAMF